MISTTRFLKIWPVQRIEVIANYEKSKDNLIIPERGPAVLDAIFQHLHEGVSWDILVLHCRPGGDPPAESLPELCRKYGFQMLPLGVDESRISNSTEAGLPFIRGWEASATRMSRRMRGDWPGPP